MTSFYHPKLETLPRAELKERQLDLLKRQFERALNAPFYADLLKNNPLPEIKTLDDIAHLPLLDKEDLRRAYPDGLIAVDKKDIVRIHTSSGTTGIPSVLYLTQNDLDDAADTMARGLWMAGLRPTDTFQIMVSYGLFTGGLMMHYGAEKLGAAVLPASTGNTLRQLQYLHDFKVSAIHLTPGYLQHLINALEEKQRFAPSLKTAIVGAESLAPQTREWIEKRSGLELFDCYGLSEMNGPGVAMECAAHHGMHVWEDRYLMEIIDPQTLQPVPEGEYGELVLTDLTREAMPLLRYRTHDITRILTEPCACGRTHRRIDAIQGRTDDMLIINGVNVFPSQIEAAIFTMIPTPLNWVVHIGENNGLKKLSLTVEVPSEQLNDQSLLNQLSNLLQAFITVKPDISFVPPKTLPAIAGKSKRIITHK